MILLCNVRLGSYSVIHISVTAALFHGVAVVANTPRNNFVSQSFHVFVLYLICSSRREALNAFIR